MKQIVPDVYLVEGLRTANVYLLTSEKGLTLVDSGAGGDADQIVAQLTEAGCAPAEFGKRKFRCPCGGEYRLAADATSGVCSHHRHA